jgi:4-alpha-glucanotransferase
MGFIAPENYPREALACLSTHDLPTFRGWWRGDDIALRKRFGLISDTGTQTQERTRQIERADLLKDLRASGWLSREDAVTITPDDAPDALIRAVHAHLVQAPSRLFAARLEDLAGALEPVNVPATVDEYPNWRHKLALPLDHIAQTPLFRDTVAALRKARPRSRR